MAKDKNQTVATLLDAIQHFADEYEAIQYVARLRWLEGEQHCPHCGSVAEHYWLPSRKAWKCRDCRKVFSVKVGTIFEGSPIKLGKWLPAMWMLANCKNGISSYELARALGVTQKTAWFMLHRIREAMKNGSLGKMDGEVEADETYIGGKAKFMHKSRRERIIHGTGGMDKTAVMGLLERPRGSEHSLVRTMILDDTTKARMQAEVRKNVAPGAAVFTDAHSGYRGLSKAYMHEVVDHASTYVEGKVHTNGLENFWSLVKRTLHGTYVSIEPFHVFRYLDEQAFRFNNRKANDAQRFVRLVREAVGKRLDYETLTGRRQTA
jgi:transposase-like protein